MHTVENSIVVRSPSARVYEACTDLDRWPRIFSSVQSMTHTPVGDGEVIMEMRVINDLGENVVRSHRYYQAARSYIGFEMLSLPPAIAVMNGSWQVKPDEAGARLEIVHHFIPEEDVEVTAEELAATIHRTTDRVLGELRDYLEREESEDLRDAYGERTEANGITAETFENCELFFSRLGLTGLDWGDITLVLKDLRKVSTFEDWDDWHARWTARGEHYERRADEAVAGGFPETARYAFRRAAACHHFAEFMYFDAPEKKNASRARVTEVFERGRPYLKETVRPFTVPYGELELPGYLLAPEGAEALPAVILINGLDAAKEVELYAFAREFLARGMAAVVFDGPGQGLLLGHTPMAVDFEHVVAAVLEEVTEHPEVDRDRVGIFGVSYGGYLAARAAALVPGFKACVNLSGGYDHDTFHDLNVMVRKDFRFVFEMPDDNAMAELAKTSLNLRDVPPLRVPLLAIHGELDSIIPMESCERMLEWAAGETELIRYPGERHVATNYFNDFIPRFCDWMGARLGATG
ncbi:alpha/beta hydrolase [Nonomuraea typhae]|uniref:Alpha/beta hydrolase n=1 Tax=Nonomuraea typhae TaxID=2603600 RepID=A0ABW7YRG6_9ACTN